MSDVPVPGSRGRVLAYRITVGVLGVAVALAGFALLSLIGGWFGAGDRDIHRIHDIAWGLLGGVLISTGLIVQALRPDRWVAPAQQALAGAFVLILGVVISGELAFAAIPAVVIGLLIALHPDRGRLLEIGREGMDGPMLLQAALAAVPLVLYALNQAEIQRACPPTDGHCEEFHWAQMAALAMALPLVGAVAALRAPGWRLTAWCAGIAATLWGIASLAFPGHASALDQGWAVAAVVGGVAFIGMAEWGRRST